MFNMFLYFPLCRNPDKGVVVSAITELRNVHKRVPKDYTREVTFVMLNIFLMFYIPFLSKIISYDNNDPYGNDDLKECDPRKLPCCSSREATLEKSHKKVVCLFVKIYSGLSICLSIYSSVYLLCICVCQNA